jgi:DnaJ-class molecular chaperone
MANTAARTPYEVLGVRDNADAEVIQAAYRALARKHHPDMAGKSGEAKMKEINAAWEVLSDPEQRASYDAERRLAAIRASTPSSSQPPGTAAGVTRQQHPAQDRPAGGDGGDAAREWFRTHTSTAAAPPDRGMTDANHAWTVSGSITFRAARLAVRAALAITSSVVSSEASQGQGLATGAAVVFFVVVGVIVYLPARLAVESAIGNVAIGLGAILAFLAVLDVMWFWIRKRMRG